MYCPNCGKAIDDSSVFCQYCGNRIGVIAEPATYYSNRGQMYDRPPKKPSTIVPFLLGLFLGLIGIILSVVVYNGNDGPYTKNPTTHALLWSLIGMIIWVPIIFIFLMIMMNLR